MLVSFSLQNYRSFYAKQTFNCVADHDRTLLIENCIETPFTKAKWIHKTDAIFGPNASGKSTFYSGLLAVWYLVMFSSAQQGAQWQLFARYKPFAFADGTESEPTEFETCFIEDNKMYWLTIAYIETRIVRETLHVQEATKKVLLYSRSVDPTDDRKDIWEWGSSLQGKKSIWRDLTRPDSLFLSTAVQFNSEQLAIPARWFATHLAMLSGMTPIGTQMADHFIETDKQRIMGHLRNADPGLVDAQLDDETQQSLSLKLSFGGNPAPVQAAQNEQKIRVLRFTHESPITHKQVKFALHEESSGTQTFYSMLGLILTAIDNGSVVFIDEIDTSLHPLIVSYIVKLFHNPEINAKGAQLFFTTHDVTQLSSELLRRDQIWLMEKQPSLESKLYPISEYSPRKSEALLKGYLAGRYGAIPLIN